MVKNKVEPHEQTLKEDIIVRLIKMLNMGYTNVIYIIPTIFIATLLDKHIYSNIQIGDTKKDEDKRIMILLIEIIIILTINGIVCYILRNVLQKMPFPFEGTYGFDHMKVMEIKNGAVITLVLMYFAPIIVNKLKTLQQKFSKVIS
jgi:hypothetical protein